MNHYRFRRFVLIVVTLLIVAVPFATGSVDVEQFTTPIKLEAPSTEGVFEGVNVQGRAPKTGYSRTAFGSGWATASGCDTRNLILQRDLRNSVVDEQCKVQSGSLPDPYTGSLIAFVRGETSSDDVQIDHVVALSNAWQTGAQGLSFEERLAMANDPLNLLAVDGGINQQKSDSDAASWLPPNKSFRCQYVKRQLDVKRKYQLWITPAERDAMGRVLAAC